MTVRLVGANPGLLLHADGGGGPPVAFVSAWRVDWSTHGRGSALVLWHAGRTQVVSPDPVLGEWLAAGFTRHFPEVRGLPWPPPEGTTAPVRMEIDLGAGMRAAGGGIEVEITDPMDRRLVRVDDFDLGGTPNVLSTVYIPCRSGTLRVGGEQVAGVPQVTTSPRASSTAFLADAEVWCHPR